MTGERSEDHALAGLEHLQAAAREVIQATRSLLDAAEALVEDPAAVQSVVGTFTSLVQAAAGRLRRDDEPGEGEDDGRVQRIRIS